ncbi:MAG: rhomboid family intramembrane serine protease [Bacteroidia bacterium]
MNFRLPDIVKNLLIINGLFFLALSLYPDFMFEKFALYFPKSEYFMPHQFVTHMFMHGGFNHILGNMFGLFFLGPMLEYRMGAKRFLTYYIITGLGAAALHLGVAYLQYFSYVGELGTDVANEIMQLGYDYRFTNDLEVSFLKFLYTPTVGASGAVFGILLAFGMLFPNVELMMIFIPIPIKAKYFVLGYGVLELFLGLSNNPGDNVAHFAHLGGMLFGFFLIRQWRSKGFI